MLRLNELSYKNWLSLIWKPLKRSFRWDYARFCSSIRLGAALNGINMVCKSKNHGYFSIRIEFKQCFQMFVLIKLKKSTWVLPCSKIFAHPGSKLIYWPDSTDNTNTNHSAFRMASLGRDNRHHSSCSTLVELLQVFWRDLSPHFSCVFFSYFW